MNLKNISILGAVIGFVCALTVGPLSKSIIIDKLAIAIVIGLIAGLIVVAGHKLANKHTPKE